jgi:hypothetical protein
VPWDGSERLLELGYAFKKLQSGGLYGDTIPYTRAYQFYCMKAGLKTLILGGNPHHGEGAMRL